MKKMKEMGRQGDTLTVSINCSKLRPETKKRLFGTKLDNKVNFNAEKRLPFAYGEVSGHAHAIYEDNSAELRYSNDVQETLKQLSVTKSVSLQHEEHEAIEIPVGEYAILGQHEYIKGEIKRSLD